MEKLEKHIEGDCKSRLTSFCVKPPRYEHACWCQVVCQGETFVDQQNGYDRRYTFSAKEKDDETQYSYFGARYYDSDLSVWMSVDPMSDKYPSMSAYMYCAGNPVMLVDPDGREFDPASEEYLQKYKSEIQNRLNELRASRNTEGADLQDIKGQIKELKSARRELRAMERSSTLFKIRELTDEQFKFFKSGFTAYDEGDNSVYIVFDFLSTLCHEMRHGYGLITGEISYNKGAGFNYSDPSSWNEAIDKQLGTLYDLRDEEVAYKRMWAFMSTEEKAGIIGIDNYTKLKDWSLGNPKTKWIYDDYKNTYNIGTESLSIRNTSSELLKNQILFNKR